MVHLFGMRTQRAMLCNVRLQTFRHHFIGGWEEGESWVGSRVAVLGSGKTYPLAPSMELLAFGECGNA